jgi:hypothetical protein
MVRNTWILDVWFFLFFVYNFGDLWKDLDFPINIINFNNKLALNIIL